MISERCALFLSSPSLHLIWSPGARRLAHGRECLLHETCLWICWCTLPLIVVIVGYQNCKRVFSDEVPLPALVIKKSIHGAMVAATSRHAGVSGKKEQYNYTIELMAMLGVFGAVINIIQMSNRDYQLTATSLANMPQLHWEICHTALFLSEKNFILLNGMLVLQLATATSLANRPQCDLWRDDCLGKLPVCVRR